MKREEWYQHEEWYRIWNACFGPDYVQPDHFNVRVITGETRPRDGWLQCPTDHPDLDHAQRCPVCGGWRLRLRQVEPEREGAR